MLSFIFAYYQRLGIAYYVRTYKSFGFFWPKPCECEVVLVCRSLPVSEGEKMNECKLNIAPPFNSYSSTILSKARWIDGKVYCMLGVYFNPMNGEFLCSFLKFSRQFARGYYLASIFRNLDPSISIIWVSDISHQIFFISPTVF